MNDSMRLPSDLRHSGRCRVAGARNPEMAGPDLVQWAKALSGAEFILHLIDHRGHTENWHRVIGAHRL